MLVKYNEPLSRHTSFKIGGPAFCWVEPEGMDDILEAIALSEKNNKTFFVFGKGTNLLVRDEGYDGVAICLGRKGFDSIENEGDGVIRITAGSSISKLIKYASRACLSGCEFLIGIPGNLGGAIFMNAGVRDLEDVNRFREIKDIILDVEVLDLLDRKRKALGVKDIDFRYRSSNLNNKVILGARIKLKKDKKSNILERTNSFMKRRQWIQGLGLGSAGSVFKNPEGDKPAGMLIEACGLKGKVIGNAEISRLHANFIVNLGSAKAKDVLELIKLARESVKERFGVDLELEIKVV